LPMIKFVTLKDVAMEAGTTAGTVSYVLNGSGKGRYISEEMRSKVHDAAKKLNYVRSSGASDLKKRSSRTIAILVPQFDNQFFTRIVLSAQSVVSEAGYFLIICNTGDDPESELGFINRMIEERVVGFLITPTVNGSENAKVIKDIGMPLVAIDRPFLNFGEYNFVETDNYNLGKLTAKALTEEGHRKIGFIGWDSGFPTMDLRQKAFMEEAGRDGAFETASLTEEAGYEATKVLLEKHPDVTGLVFGFHLQALGGIKYLKQSGRRIPEDLSVVVSGSPSWVTAALNDFTHVHMNEELLGKKAAELLIKQIEGEIPENEKSHVLQPCTLIKGGTVKHIRES